MVFGSPWIPALKMGGLECIAIGSGPRRIPGLFHAHFESLKHMHMPMQLLGSVVAPCPEYWCLIHSFVKK